MNHRTLRYKIPLESVARIEASCEEDNRYRKIAEVRSQAEFCARSSSAQLKNVQSSLG